MLALLAQLFAFQAGWGAPPVPPPPGPTMLLAQQAVAEAIWYCRDRGLACRPEGAWLLRGDVWRVRFDAWRRGHHGEVVLDLDAWSGALLAVRGRPHPWWRSDDEDWERRRHWDDDRD